MIEQTPMGVGLAEQTGMTQQQDPQAAFMEILAMLKQGVSPEELMKMGIPQEIIEEAMAMIAQEQQVGPEQAGLAGMQLQGM